MPVLWIVQCKREKQYNEKNRCERREQKFVFKLLFAMAVQEYEEESLLGSLQSWRSKAESWFLSVAFANA